MLVSATADILPQPPYPENTQSRGYAPPLDVRRIHMSTTWNLADAVVRPWLLMLWVEAWRGNPAGSYENDPKSISERIGCSLEFFEEHRERLMRGWELCEDGRFYHKYITKLVLKMIGTRESGRKRIEKHRKIKKNGKKNKNNEQNNFKNSIEMHIQTKKQSNLPVDNSVDNFKKINNEGQKNNALQQNVTRYTEKSNALQPTCNALHDQNLDDLGENKVILHQNSAKITEKLNNECNALHPTEPNARARRNILPRISTVVQNKTPPKPPPKKSKPLWTLPDWVNAEAWAEFEAHRKTSKAKLTDLARTKNANLLKGLSASEQRQVIDETIAAGWTGLFPQRLKNRHAVNSRYEDGKAIAAAIAADTEKHFGTSQIFPW